jgi:hypothetical protein
MGRGEHRVPDNHLFRLVRSAIASLSDQAEWRVLDALGMWKIPSSSTFPMTRAEATTMVDAAVDLLITEQPELLDLD